MSKCPYEGYECDCSGEIKERHRNTAFCWKPEDGGDNPNLIVSCEAHYQIDYDRYQELWDEYYSGRF